VTHVINPYAFSYPGCNEMITGGSDPRVDKNEFGPNPNMSVFEWLNKQPDLAIASGDGLPLALSVDNASPTECRLVEVVLAGCFLSDLPALYLDFYAPGGAHRRG
jgi:hypothetical protein